jgi:DNA (cytosine-5)-methyltransferase 1
MTRTSAFDFIDLFAGLGGFHLAATKLGGRCVFASELNPKLRNVYQRNFGMNPAGDIRQVGTDAIPAHELLCAGFPCQPFSKAGDQEGLADSDRGQVVFEVFRIIDQHRPEYLLFENVANFVRHDNGNTYQRIYNELISRGYDIQYKQFSPHQFGIPQIRERIYLVGAKNGLANFEWPIPPTNLPPLNLRNILARNLKKYKPISNNVILCIETWQKIIQSIPEDNPLPSFPIWAMEFGATYPLYYDSLWQCPIKKLRESKGAFGQKLEGLSRKEIMELIPSYASYHKNSFPEWKCHFIEQNRAFYKKHQKEIRPHLKNLQLFPASYQKLEWNCQGETRDLWQYILQFRASGLRVKRPSTSPSLVAMTTTQIPIIGWLKRYMTLSECARLQSMHDLHWLPEGGTGFKALGNAVNVHIAHAILEQLIKSQTSN